MKSLLLLVVFPFAAQADSLVATRTLRAETILAPADMMLVAQAIPGALEDPSLALGQEARVTLYAGRPIRAADIGPPAIVDRNQIVALHYAGGGLSILTEGRALARGGVGDVIRVMNLASRSTVSGRIGAGGEVSVGAMGAMP
ncbi:flagellar basal body P-ring formation protein FlgA [Fertoebacter nigrum]|uniref:Flagella basal body P-ring formation protein FlgA n=1 Tax=Fertoeibacter niger TaxID=2656921 RepID=A0A8X8H794_9RHOB|nr:flagellar basal body P-ring formation chaperone FlgA [Fertoeibacter niger]NUB44611.1 flagellar basal body P-ring formation protein FlgA [Fertoeibacter niger]